jgi:hypothetical protein
LGEGSERELGRGLAWNDLPFVMLNSLSLEEVTLDLVFTSTSEDELATVNTNGFGIEAFSWTDLNSWFVSDVLTESSDMSPGTITTKLSGVEEESWVAISIPELDVQ